MSATPPPPPSGGYTPPAAQAMSPEDQRLWATLNHIGGIFFGVVSTLVIFLVLKDRGGFIRQHSIAALNFHITMAIALAVGSLLTLLFIGVLVILAVYVVVIIFAIMAAVAANKGQPYTYPLSIKFIK